MMKIRLSISGESSKIAPVSGLRSGRVRQDTVSSASTTDDAPA